MSLLFIDIDHFKRINDDYGHQVGDRVLREVARVLTANLRKIDYVFRYGGDEFVVLMTETDSERASMLAERILAAVKRDVGKIVPFKVPGFPEHRRRRLQRALPGRAGRAPVPGGRRAVPGQERRAGPGSRRGASRRLRGRGQLTGAPRLKKPSPQVISLTETALPAASLP